VRCRFASGGAKLRDRTCGEPTGEDNLIALALHPDGGLILAGVLTSPTGTGRDGWLLRTDDEDNICGP
jgi:hypothetical protein